MGGHHYMITASTHGARQINSIFFVAPTYRSPSGYEVASIEIAREILRTDKVSNLQMSSFM